MILASLLALCVLGDGTFDWLWDRVDEQDVVGYRLLVARRSPAFYECQDDEGQAYLCAEYPAWASMGWILADEQPQVAAVPEGTSLCSTWDPGSVSGDLNPPLHSIDYVRVVAVDAAGNVGE